MMRTLPNFESFSQAAAELVMEQSKKAIEARGRFSLVLSGGSTPRRTYELLATKTFRTSIEWDKVHIFWGDERCVPPDDPRSNERMARETFLDHVSIPQEQIHPIRCGSSPQQSAQAYESTLKAFFGDHDPSFDTVLLGLGVDGHTASLFPGSPALKENKRWVVATHSGNEDFERVTLTPVLINRAMNVVFLVAGKEKARILREVTEDAAVGDPLPARLIRPAGGQLVWLVDKQACGVE
jgi:6-phosphogluconolactonase